MNGFLYYNRVQAYIVNCWASKVVDPDCRTVPDETPTLIACCDNKLFQDIKTVNKSPSEIPPFSNAQIVSYFVTRTVTDGLASSDFKLINQSALNLFSMWTCTKS